MDYHSKKICVKKLKIMQEWIKGGVKYSVIFPLLTSF